MDRKIWDQMAALENRLEDIFRASPFLVPARPFLGQVPARPYAPAMDVMARNGDVVLRFDLPGIDPAKDVTVTAEGDELTVRGERKTTEEVEEENYYRTEVVKGTFERDIQLPEGTPADKITAQYANGVLEIVVPGPAKPIKAKPKEIPVKFETVLKA